MTVVVELQVHQRFIQKNLLKLVVQKFRKVMHLQNVNCRDYLEEKKLATLLRSVMTLVPAVFQLLLVNWQTDLHINLDKVPKKYAGLDGTEIAISESQERMAVVVDKSDVDQFLKYANEENLRSYSSSRSYRRTYV